jgi:hypothetical protein
MLLLWGLLWAANYTQARRSVTLQDDLDDRLVTCRLDELRPHPSYVRHHLSVSTAKLSVLADQGELVFRYAIAEFVAALADQSPTITDTQFAIPGCLLQVLKAARQLLYFSFSGKRGALVQFTRVGRVHFEGISGWIPLVDSRGHSMHWIRRSKPMAA